MTNRTRSLSTLLVLCLLSLPALLAAQEAEDAAAEQQKILYAVGMAVAQQLAVLDLSDEELTQVQRGLTAMALGREPEVDLQTYGPKIAPFIKARVAAKAQAEKDAAADFLAGEAAKPGAETTDSGLVISELSPGTGENPKATDSVTVHYHGTLRDGTVFDSSVDRGAPATFALNQVIPCWTEGVQKMKVGGKSRLVCPSDLAYGDGGAPPKIPGGAPLVFEVELLEIQPAATAEQPSE